MNLNINLRQLKAFLGVAETCNFTRAAQSLHLSQAALSASIRELEGQLRCADGKGQVARPPPRD